MLIIIVAAVVLLALIGGGAAFFLMKKKPADEEGEGEAAAKAAAPKVVHKAPPDPKKPPTYLPMEPMVVNLADPGGGRFVQLGITLKLDEPKTGEIVKQFMPSIRSAVLLTVSKRTADELLAIEGKEKLTRAIIRVTSEQLGYEVEDEDEEAESTKKKKKRNLPPSPVEDVLYSSFIVQ
ncbi:MAG: flagellar basal body-associated FliL family protein [Burkholderiaceae bacterium]